AATIDSEHNIAGQYVEQPLHVAAHGGAQELVGKPLLLLALLLRRAQLVDAQLNHTIRKFSYNHGGHAASSGGGDGREPALAQSSAGRGGYRAGSPSRGRAPPDGSAAAKRRDRAVESVAGADDCVRANPRRAPAHPPGVGGAWQPGAPGAPASARYRGVFAPD